MIRLPGGTTVTLRSADPDASPEVQAWFREVEEILANSPEWVLEMAQHELAALKRHGLVHDAASLKTLLLEGALSAE